MILCAPLFVVGQSARVFTLKGKVVDVEGILDNMIYLKFAQNGVSLIDSAKLSNGEYSFSGEIMYPTKATIQLKVADSVERYHMQTRFLRDYTHEFYIDGGHLVASAPKKMNSTIVQGSAADSDRQRLDALLKPLYTSNDKLYREYGDRAYREKDSVAIAAYLKQSYATTGKIDSIEKDFLFSHPQSGIALDLLQDYTRSMLEFSEIASFFAQLQPDLRNSVEGQKYAERLQQAEKTAKGTVAPDFTLKDREGREVSLSSLKGKVILLDFWGSWCFPCRQTHPHLRELYVMYRDKGFEILGVANERGDESQNYKKWTQALDEDQMTWVNLLGTAKGNIGPDVPSIYSVSAYPTKVLIGRDGNIIRRFVGSGKEAADELDKLLAELL